MELIKTNREWKNIYAVVIDRFNAICTEAQLDKFDAACLRKFPRGYDITNADTTHEYQTAVSLILNFVHNERIEWKYRYHSS